MRYGEKDIHPLFSAIMHHVGSFVFPDHKILNLAGPFTAFETAALLSREAPVMIATRSARWLKNTSWWDGSFQKLYKCRGNVMIEHG